jgi:hypothetical protein
MVEAVYPKQFGEVSSEWYCGKSEKGSSERAQKKEPPLTRGTRREYM